MYRRKSVWRTFLALAVIAGALFSWSGPGAFAAVNPQVALASSPAWQFQQPLPILSVNPYTLPLTLPPYLKEINTVIGSQPLTIRMCEFQAKILPPGAITPGVQTTTWVWGYLPDPTGTSTCASLIDLNKDPATGALETYTGPVIVNTRGTSTPITFINDLGTVNTGNALTDTKVEFYKYSIDQTLAWADPIQNEANNCANTGGIPAFGSPCAQNYSGPIAAVVHLHGGDVPPELDGGPDAWVTSDGLFKGHGYYSFAGAPANGAIYKYANRQEAAPIWFHDHLLGGTRLNVHAGLAGAYYIQDPALTLPTGLQPLTEVIPIVIQDRMFDTNGQLFFPADNTGGVLYSPNPEHPYWVPEFFGDTILVNGKAWPFLDVEAKRYRFLFVNGSNARAYVLNMGPPFWVIGTDGGYLDAPVMVNKLTIMPGERYEVIIDFAGFAGKKGKNIILTNTGRAPFPKGVAPGKTPVSDVMQFRVHPVAAGFVDPSYNPALGTPLRTGTQAIVRLANPVAGTLAPLVTVAKTRQLTLNENLAPPPPAGTIDPVTGLSVAYLGGPLEVLVNNTKYDGKFQGFVRGDFTPVSVGGKTTYYSELSQEGDTEVWEIVNMTVDAHPIHLHLVQFQVINRQAYQVNKYTKAYNAAFPGGGIDPLTGLPYPPGIYIPGYGPPLNYNPPFGVGKFGGNPDITPYLGKAAVPPLPEEAGWKDTVVSYPGEVTRIAVRFAPTDLPTTAVPAALYYPFDPSGGAFPHGYVWHCHIIDHEDNEMMRPSSVSLNPIAPAANARPLQKGIHY